MSTIPLAALNMWDDLVFKLLRFNFFPKQGEVWIQRHYPQRFQWHRRYVNTSGPCLSCQWVQPERVCQGETGWCLSSGCFLPCPVSSPAIETRSSSWRAGKVNQWPPGCYMCLTLLWGLESNFRQVHCPLALQESAITTWKWLKKIPKSPDSSLARGMKRGAVSCAWLLLISFIWVTLYFSVSSCRLCGYLHVLFHREKWWAPVCPGLRNSHSQHSRPALPVNKQETPDPEFCFILCLMIHHKKQT